MLTFYTPTRRFLTANGVVPLPGHAPQALKVTARASGLAAIAVFTVLLARYGLPQSIEQQRWESAIQMALLGIALLGYLIAWRWEGLGGTLLCLAGVAIGVLATVAYQPHQALVGSLALVVPGVLFLLHWQAAHSRWLFAIVAASLAVGLAWGAVAASNMYERYWGPFHPESDTPAIPVDLVTTIWAGGVTTDAFSIKANPVEDLAPLDLVVSTDPGLTGGIRIPAEPAGDNDLGWQVSGLEDNTRYYYAAADGSHIDLGRQGSVRTLSEAPASFTIAFGSCLQTGSNGSVFDRIREANPLFFVVPGDFQYDNVARDNMDAFEHTYEANLEQPAQQAMLLDVPIVYTWDDHDFGGNNANRTTDSRNAAWRAYREYVPHYELANPDTGPIYFAFTQGRIRFVATDLRSERDPAGTPNRSMLGAEQKAWLKREFLAARDAGLAIAWISSVPWIDPAREGADTWGGFPEERHELAQFIADNGLTARVMVLSGDAHMLAADDGTNSNYSDTSGKAFPVMHAAALDRPGSRKGGPYSHGSIPGAGQFALLAITDHGGDMVTVHYSGRDYTGTELLSLEFRLSVR